MPAGFPLGLAAQGAAFAGMKSELVGRDQIDWYDYFDTRIGIYHRGMLIQSLALGPAEKGLRLHCNEGLAFATGNAGNLLILDAGLQQNWGPAVLGLEAHSRTLADAIDMLDDPLWVTPSAQWRTGWNANLTAGADFALSRRRDPSAAARPWRPWRLLGGVAFTLDGRWERERDAK